MKLKATVKIAISFLLIALLVWKVDMGELVRVVAGADTPRVVMILLAFLLGTMLKTLKWRVLLVAQSINDKSLFGLWSLIFKGLFFSNFLPTEIGGDFYRSYQAGRKSGRQQEAFASVVMDRLSGLLVVVFFAGIALALNWELSGSLNVRWPVFGVTAAVAAAIYLASHRDIARWIRDAISVRPLRKSVRKLEEFYEVFYLYKKKRGVLSAALAYSLVFQLFSIWYTWALAHSLRMDVRFGEIFLVVPLITIIGLVPITLNSIGLREGAFVYFFSHVGVDSAESFALALLYRVGILASSLVGGALYAAGGGDDARED